MSRITVNEGSTSYHAIIITDKSGATVVPESLRYKLSDSIGVLIEWTSLDISTTEIVIPAAMNVIGIYGRKRFLTVEATHNGGDKIPSEIEYELVDLKGV